MSNVSGCPVHHSRVTRSACSLRAWLPSVVLCVFRAPARSIPAILPRLLPSDALPPAAADTPADGAAMLHIALPGDPLYPLDDAGTFSADALSVAASPLLHQQALWHRMLRSSDPADAVTQIFRPPQLHLKASAPLSKL